MSEQLSETTALRMDDMLGIPEYRGIRVINSMLAIADTSAQQKINREAVRSAEQVETDIVVDEVAQALRTLEGVGLLTAIQEQKELLKKAETAVESNIEDYHKRHLEISEQLEIINLDLAAHRIVFASAKSAYEEALALFQGLDEQWQATKTIVEYGLESAATANNIQSRDEVELLFQQIAARLTDPQTTELAMDYKQAADEKNLKEATYNAAVIKLSNLQNQKTDELEKLRLLTEEIYAEIPDHKRYARRIGKSGSHIRQETLTTRGKRLGSAALLFFSPSREIEAPKHGVPALGEAAYATEA